MGETILMEAVIPGSALPPLAGPLTDTLIGRDHELRLIGEFLDRGAQGGAAMLVIGEPGVGKSALLDAAEECGAARGTRVLRACGAEFEADLPFAGLHQVLLPLADEFERLSEPQRTALNVALGFGSGPAPDRLIVCNATLTLVRSAAAHGPMLIIVDDVHWLDRATAPVLGFLARRLAGSTVAFLAASRTDATGFFEHAGLAELDLEPLGQAAASKLMSSAFPELTASVRDRLLSQARGNPLAVLELPGALAASGSGAVDESRSAVLPLSRRLQAVYASRLAGLPQSCRDALLMMALDSTNDTRVPQASDTGRHGLSELGPAERARLIGLNRGSQRLTFRHPLIRSAVVELASDDERRQAHRRLAELMSAEPDRRAWHLGQATIEQDEQVAVLLEQAAHRVLRRGDAIGAVAALIRASELSPAAQDRARRLADAAYLGANATGELENAEALLSDARCAYPEAEASVEMAIAAAFVLLNGDGDVRTAHRLLLGAMQTARSRNVSTVTAEWGLLTLELVCHYGGRADLWESFERYLGCFRSSLPPGRLLHSALVADPVRSRRPALDRLDADITALAHVVDSTEVIRIAGVSTFVDRLPACRPALRRVARDELNGGAVTSVIYANVLLAFEAYLTGQWDEAQRLAEAAAGLCDARGYRLLGWNARATLAFLAAGRGEVAKAEALADKMIRWGTPRGVRHVQADAHYACVLAALARSDFEAAYQNAVKLCPAGQLVPYEPRAPWVMLDLVEAALRTDRAGAATAHVQAILDTEVAQVSSRLALLASAATAAVAADDEAVVLFEQALATTGAELWQFDQARVHLLYGERLRRMREMTRARFQLDAALRAFRRLGAQPWTERAAMELRATGRTRSAGERIDRETLTPQELEIAMLAAGGLSNKQIGSRLYLSHRTVGAHLYRAFPKLGITSRAALRDALERLPAG
jgi:DNA-binding CsgD family transcriptional regulator